MRFKRYVLMLIIFSLMLTIATAKNIVVHDNIIAPNINGSGSGDTINNYYNNYTNYTGNITNETVDFWRGNSQNLTNKTSCI